MKKLTLILTCFAIVIGAVQASPPPTKASNQDFASTPVDDIVYAKPFSLEQGYIYDWRKDRPFVKQGTLVVLKVNGQLVVPRDALQPQLFADQHIVQRLNHGHESGHVIAIIPGEIDLSRISLWFAQPGVSEQISTNKISYEHILENNNAIKPFDSQKISSVMHSETSVSNLYVLLRDVVAELVKQYSPEDKHLAYDWQLPVASK